MLKRTLYFGNPAKLRVSQSQLSIELTPEDHHTVPLEDVGMVVLDHPQIVVTQAVWEGLLEQKAAVVVCDSKHMPKGLLLSFEGHTEMNERFTAQLEASLPMRKALWAQTVRAKILNQAAVLDELKRPIGGMRKWANEVRSGDPDNYEARAAAWYWQHLFDDDFKRERFGEMPNSLFNYGYAILRATVARSLVASGLHPAIGIHHSNKYNAFCLADDLMEPYRPYVDLWALKLWDPNREDYFLTKEDKRHLLQIPVLDVVLNKKTRPLSVATQLSTAALAQVYLGEKKKIAYPEL